MIQISKKQSEALNEFYALTGGTLKNQLAFLIRDYGRFVDVYKPLNDIPFDEFAELLVTEQYEVKRTIEEVIDDFMTISKDQWEDGANTLLRLKKKLKQEGLI
ncbi:hypothetical protein Glittering_60 [Bacillus phage Glittering]|uniref:Uncharacterized protein n=1 Tax=Bacillus phage Glittering TaxID=2884421 RepID=U5PXC8_9CAUD|nr:hypothetical protein Glittering_60 [Bacillus phage Glittering]AGY47247.1 hypothetical protein Glittering_60 [Bacillus phage Glittering]